MEKIEKDFLVESKMNFVNFRSSITAVAEVLKVESLETLLHERSQGKFDEIEHESMRQIELEILSKSFKRISKSF